MTNQKGHNAMTRNELIEKAAATLDAARAADDDSKRDTLTRVAQGYTNLLPHVDA